MLLPRVREHLGSGVARTAARVAQHLARRAAGRQAKVGDPDVAVLVEQQVLRLDVSVHDVLRVEVADAAHNLHEEAPCLRLAAAPVLDDVLEELAPRRKPGRGAHGKVQAAPLAPEHTLAAPGERALTP